MNMTVGNIIDSLFEHVNNIQVENLAESDPEALFLESVIQTLQTVESDFAGIEVSEDQKLIVACSKIPGLLHLAKLY